MRSGGWERRRLTGFGLIFCKSGLFVSRAEMGENSTEGALEMRINGRTPSLRPGFPDPPSHRHRGTWRLQPEPPAEPNHELFALRASVCTGEHRSPASLLLCALCLLLQAALWQTLLFGAYPTGTGTGTCPARAGWYGGKATAGLSSPAQAASRSGLNKFFSIPLSCLNW